MKIITLITVLFLLIACNNREKVSEVINEYKNGKISKTIFRNPSTKKIIKSINYYQNQIIKDETEYINGMPKILKFYFEDGSLRRLVTYEKINEQTIINYYRSGKTSSRGNAIDTKKTGWWEEFSENGNLIAKYEFNIIAGEEHLNQKLIYSANGKIDKTKGFGFNIEIPDTIVMGPARIKVDYRPVYSSKSNIFVCLSKDCKPDFSNLFKTKIDTFYMAGNKKWFGINFKNPGTKILRGFIYEQFLDIRNQSNKSLHSSLEIKDYNIYFEKKVYVKNP